jgi:hypothetical protein
MFIYSIIAASPTGIIGDLGNELVKQLLLIQKELLISPLFQELNDLGVYLACFFVFFYVIRLMSEMENGNKEKVGRMMFAAVIALYFHISKGANLKTFIEFNIAAQNKITDEFAKNVIKGRTLGQVKTDKTKKDALQSRAEVAFNSCKDNQKTDPTYDVKGCLDSAKSSLPKDARPLLENIARENGQDMNWDLTGGIGNNLLDALKAFTLEMLSAVELAIRVFAQVTQMVFCLFAPLAIGALFVPGEQAAIVQWTFNFWKIWLFRFSSIMISGLISMVFESSADGIVGLVLGVSLAFLSPWLSFIVATGSGSAIMQGLTSGATNGAGGAAGGASRAARAIGRKTGLLKSKPMDVKVT